MERRAFIRTTTLAGSGLFAFSRLEGMGSDLSSTNPMTYTTLGRTGEKVSKLGLGCAPLGRKDLDPKEAMKMVAKAFDDGVTYFDVAPNYANGMSEERLGEAVKDFRKHIFLATKTEASTYEGTWRLINQSLGRLKTDYIDLVHLHNLGREDRWPDLDMVFSDDGAMGALREAKQKGVVRFIGNSGHVYPSRLHYAIDSGEIDVMMVAVNYIIQHNYDFEHKIWLRALTKDIGMVAMKVLGGAELSDRSHRIPSEDYEMAIRYALTLQGLSSAVVGVKTLDEYDLLIKTFLDAMPLTEDEYISLSKRGLEILEKDQRWRTMHGLPLT